VPREQVRPATAHPGLLRCFRLARAAPVLPACRSIPRGVTGGMDRKPGKCCEGSMVKTAVDRCSGPGVVWQYRRMCPDALRRY
jgi:hypothetical protein